MADWVAVGISAVALVVSGYATFVTTAEDRRKRDNAIRECQIAVMSQLEALTVSYSNIVQEIDLWNSSGWQAGDDHRKLPIPPFGNAEMAQLPADQSERLFAIFQDVRNANSEIDAEETLGSEDDAQQLTRIAAAKFALRTWDSRNQFSKLLGWQDFKGHEGQRDKLEAVASEQPIG